MKHFRLLAIMLVTVTLAFTACGGGGGSGGSDEDSIVTISAIHGVTPPNYGETPVTIITETAQYTGTVSWSPSDTTFAATTVYTATITLTAKSGYTLTGVTSDFFTVPGSTGVTNSADSGEITAVFPATGTVPATVINIAAIPGVTVPVLGLVPVTSITETSQYTGTVTWDGDWAWSNRFGGQKAYTATITLTAKSGYTLTGVAANFFTVAGTSTAAANSAGSGVVTAVFPATASAGAIGDSALGGKVAYILQSGDPGYVAGEQRGLIAADSDQSKSIVWAKAAYQSTTVQLGTGTTLGTGSGNTDRIIAQNGAGTTYAAGIARAYNGGGYTDWFLPSKDELDKLYLNKAAIGNFVADGRYWSSSEDWPKAWYQYFYNGGQGTTNKDYNYMVRAVRAF